MKQDQDLMTCLEVCEYLGTNLNNLRQITFRKHINPVKKKVGRYKLFPRAEVEAYKVKRDKRGKK